MSGLQLSGMEASDMIDVIHYMFEDDFSNISTAEHLEAQSKMRSSLYKNLYKRQYKYENNYIKNSSGIKSFDPEEMEIEELEPLDPMKMSSQVKPYVPPTEFNPDYANPFGNQIDSPLN